MRARYLTTTLPYVNADPHLGFALEVVQADVLARMWRLAGDEVFFSIGTDEHGQKILEAAQKAGQEPHIFADQYVTEYKKLKDALNLSTDTFIRTSDPAHIRAAQEMWRRCAAKGDIYKKAYTGLYCVGCEAFKTEHELNEQKHCQLHPNIELQKVSEENYFFRFSNYQERLEKYLAQPNVIIPEWRRTEAQLFVKNGLEDFSISREKKRLPWGIPVPGDETQVMYVWFDALTSYISALGWPSSANATEGEPDLFKKFWEEGTTFQVAGKDQVRFQSLMWQAMLMSAGIKNTDTIFYHGFITSGGQKMSKSLGNVINPLALVEKYGSDAVRYVLLRHVSSVEDSDLTLEAIHDYYTAHLTNGLGNLVARVMKLAETYLPASEIVKKGPYTPAVFEAVERFEFSTAMNEVWEQIQELDQGITVDEPFKVVRADLEAGRNLIAGRVVELQGIAEALEPFMPDTSKKIVDAIKTNKKPDNLFPRI